MSTESEEKAAADKVVAAAMAAIGDTGGDSVDSSSNTNDNDNRVNEADNKAHKRKERLEQNRISARESRKRKKTMIEELQRTVITLSKENKDLNDRNEHLRQQLMEIGTKVCGCMCDVPAMSMCLIDILYCGFSVVSLLLVTTFCDFVDP
jgi:predicted RNase H-like nuclease (RuvC/YqgF family)